MIRAAPLLALALLLAACGGDTAAYERGLAAFEEGDLRTARVEFLNAIQADPANVQARIMQARVKLAAEDGIGAEAEIVRAREAGAPVPETAHLFAHARLLQGDARGAIAEAARADEANQAYAQRVRGLASLALGRGGDARAAFDRATALAPDDSEIWVDVARFRRGNGDIAGALQAADRAVAANERNGDALVLRGELTRGQYGLAAALPWFDRALEVDPEDSAALLARAATYGDMGRAHDMLADTREVLRLTGGHPTAFYLQAVLAARARDFELARSLWNRTDGAYDETPAGQLLLAAIEFETGAAGQAAQRLANLLDEQPGNDRVRRLLAAAQWRANNAAGTAATLRPLVDRPDADAYALTLMGRALQRQGDTIAASLYLARAARPGPGALAALDRLDDAEFIAARRAAAARPRNGPAQVRLISALLARGMGGEALQRARRLQAANRGAPQVHVLVGDALGLGGDFAGAAREYRNAANLAFTESTAIRLIEALQRSGQSAAADNVLRLFVAQNPRNVPALVMLAGREMQSGNWEAAIPIYEGLRQRLGSNDATILNNLAWAYAQSGAPDRALPLARRAFALNRDNPATAGTLGWLLFKQGRRADGLVLLERAARGAPSDVEIRRRLAQARRG